MSRLMARITGASPEDGQHEPVISLDEESLHVASSVLALPVTCP